MSTVRTLIRLAAMRRRAGGTLRQSVAWAAGLVYRSSRASRRQRL